MNKLLRTIRWLGFEGVLISDKPVVYINPYKLAFPDIGELILFTDNKEDHCSPDDAKWLRKGSTIVAGPADCASRFQGDVRTLAPGDRVTLKGTMVEAMPVANDANGVGLLLTFTSGLRVYHTGDTGPTKAMKPGMADILLVPVKIDSEFQIEKAAEIVNQVNPQVAIPINWDGKKESMPRMEEFSSLCQSEVEMLKAKP